MQILLDDEARNPAYRSNPYAGRVLEPMQVRLGAVRSLGAFRRDAPVGRQVELDTSFEMAEVTRQGFLMASPTPGVSGRRRGRRRGRW